MLLHDPTACLQRFRIEGFFEDGFPETTLDRYLPTFIATLAVKPD